MTTKLIRKKVIDYLQTADDNKVREFYAMIEHEIVAGKDEWDEDFFKELDRRSKSFEDATVKTYSWEEIKQAAIDSLKSNNK